MPLKFDAVHIRHALTDLTLVAAPQGSLAIAPPIYAVLFGIHYSYLHDGLTIITQGGLTMHARQVEEFLNAARRNCASITIDMVECTQFQRRVLEAARKIPWGRVVSYTELAEMAGSSSAVRAAASVMRNNRFPLIVPCHRVVRKDGAIGGFAGAMEGRTVDLKRKLLLREGVRI
jgi:O-6-methylguanine DNA methyltransferase